MGTPEILVKEPTLKQKHSAGIRIWHWLTLIVMSGSLITALLAKTIFATGTNIPLVQETLQQNNITVSQQQAREVSNEFNDILWHWHQYIGYVLAALFGFRIILEFIHPKEQKLIPALKSGIRYLKTGKGDIKETRHYLFVKYLYMLFYLALLAMALTGLFMAYSDDIDSLKEIRHNVKEVHSAIMWVIVGYLALHIGGVTLAEIGIKYKGIVSDMINGGGD